MTTKTLFSYTLRGLNPEWDMSEKDFGKNDFLYGGLVKLMDRLDAKPIFEGEVPPFNAGNIRFGYWHLNQNNVKISYMNLPVEHRMIKVSGEEHKVNYVISLLRSNLKEFRPREKMSPSFFERVKTVYMYTLQMRADAEQRTKARMKGLEEISQERD